jgi:AraC family transcriptional regulator
LSFVVEVFHYSTVHVNSLFKNRLGVSLWRYILHIRLDRACDMLISGTHAGDVALSCGFKDYSTFYRMFKKCYGITPTECRRMGKKPEMVR